MSWRIVVVSNRCKLDLKMGYMVVRGEETHRVFLDEISVLLIENPAVSLTGCLLEAMIENKIKVIFCDSTHNPMAELVPYRGSHDTSKKVRSQVAWDDESKGLVWMNIISEKIRKQAEFLGELGKEREAEMLLSYISEIEFGDETNREGHAAKVYFNAVFGMEFSRQKSCPINAALNYGYTILLSAFNREINACGYITHIGVFHDNVFNPFNLSSALMEPFRILVDRAVYYSDVTEFDNNIKRRLINILNNTVMINGAEQTVLNAIRIYIRSVFDSLEKADAKAISYYSNI